MAIGILVNGTDCHASFCSRIYNLFSRKDLRPPAITESSIPPANFPSELLGQPEDFDKLKVLSRKSWKSHLSSSPNSTYRSMVLGPAELRNILRKGLEKERTNFGTIFTAKDPAMAMIYLRSGFAENPKEEARYVVLFELAHPGNLDRHKGAYVTYDQVKPEQIKKIFFWDPAEQNKDFPFREYTNDQLKEIFLPH